MIRLKMTMTHWAFSTLRVLFYCWAMFQWAASTLSIFFGLFAFQFMKYLDGRRMTYLDAPPFVDSELYLSALNVMQPLLSSEARTMITIQIMLGALGGILEGYIWYCLGKFSSSIISANFISNRIEARLRTFSIVVAIVFVIDISTSLLLIPLASSFQVMAETFIYQFPDASKKILANMLSNLFAPHFEAHILPSLDGMALVILFLAALITSKLVRDATAIMLDRDELKQEIDLTV